MTMQNEQLEKERLEKIRELLTEDEKWALQYGGTHAMNHVLRYILGK